MDNLEWVSVVPWSKGNNDHQADGDLPEIDAKQGPGRALTEDEVKKIKTNDGLNDVHPVHLGKKDFERHVYTDRCQGCSSILREYSCSRIQRRAGKGWRRRWRATHAWRMRRYACASG